MHLFVALRFQAAFLASLCCLLVQALCVFFRKALSMLRLLDNLTFIFALNWARFSVYKHYDKMNTAKMV